MWSEMFQKDVLHDFPRDRRETDKLTVLCLFWTILKMVATFTFLEASLIFPNFLDLSEIIGRSLARILFTTGQRL